MLSSNQTSVVGLWNLGVYTGIIRTQIKWKITVTLTCYAEYVCLRVTMGCSLWFSSNAYTVLDMLNLLYCLH